MKKLLVLSLLACFLVQISAQPIDDPNSTAVQDQPAGFIQALLQSDLVKNKINNVVDLVDLNIRYLKLLKTLFTTENLILLRRSLEWFVSISNFVIRILPENPTQPNIVSLLMSLIPIVDETIDPDDELLASLPSQIVLSSSNNLQNFPSRSTVNSDDKFPLALKAVTPVSSDEEATTLVTTTDTVIDENTISAVKRDTKLTQAELDLLKSYGMSPEEAMHLANLIYKRVEDITTLQPKEAEDQPRGVTEDAQDTPIIMDLEEYMKAREQQMKS